MYRPCMHCVNGGYDKDYCPSICTYGEDRKRLKELENAVEVVRCKDCKHYHDFETHFDCAHGYGIDYPHQDDFCSYGERREENGETA